MLDAYVTHEGFKKYAFLITFFLLFTDEISSTK